MAIPTTDDMYNAPSRHIEFKYEIHFVEGSDPLVVTKDNYLVSSTGLEEAQSDSGSVLGAVSSNEISFDLYNEDKLFTPTNYSSPYYKLIRRGIRIEVFCRAVVDVETEWDQLGTFYTTEWYTTSSGIVATVTANDRLYNVFDSVPPEYMVTPNASYKDLYKSFFGALGVNVTVDDSLDDSLPFAYINGTNKEFLTELSNGALMLCFGNREDGVSVLSRLRDKALRATLTDDDQIFEITDRQSIEAGYNGISVTNNVKQESNTLEVISIKEHELARGDNELSNLLLNIVPLVRLKYAKVSGSAEAFVSSIDATTNSVNLVVTNPTDSNHSVDISVCGTVVETVSSTHTEGGSNPIVLNSNYVQTVKQLNKVVTYLRRANNSVTPTLEVVTRGNPKLRLGDKIRVQSTKFSIDYTGILIRNSYTYDGSLRSVITLLDASLLGEVPG